MVSNTIRGQFFDATDVVAFQRIRHEVDGTVKDITNDVKGNELKSDLDVRNSDPKIEAANNSLAMKI